MSNLTQPLCVSCGKPATRRCDAARADGTPCNAELCGKCTRRRSWRDLCPKHATPTRAAVREMRLDAMTHG